MPILKSANFFSTCMYVWRYRTIPPNLSPEWCEKRHLGPKPPNLMTANISGYTVCFIVIFDFPSTQFRMDFPA